MVVRRRSAILLKQIKADEVLALQGTRMIIAGNITTYAVACSADIRTGKRSTMSYVISPIQEVRTEAGHEN